MACVFVFVFLESEAERRTEEDKRNKLEMIADDRESSYARERDLVVLDKEVSSIIAYGDWKGGYELD